MTLYAEGVTRDQQLYPVQRQPVLGRPLGMCHFSGCTRPTAGRVVRSVQVRVELCGPHLTNYQSHAPR